MPTGLTQNSAGKPDPNAPAAISEPVPAQHQPASQVAEPVAVRSDSADYDHYAANRIAELEDLAMTGDTNSLLEIESELDSRDPQIQEAAVKAAIQFGSRDAIPALEAAYQRLDNPAQKINLQFAIDFLSLPTVSEMAKAATQANGGCGN